MNFRTVLLTIFSFISFICVFSTSAISSPMIYKPNNPSFGGSPFNSSHFLNLANEQKSFQTSRTSVPRTDPLQDFSRTVQRSLLSRLSQDISDAILGENAQDSGTFIVGENQIFFERIGDDISIDINDTTTGNSVNIVVPASASQ